VYVQSDAAALGLSVASEEAEHMVDMLDSDHNGNIDYREFRRFVVLLPGV
jgi:Ca2+-binding EF-hand superfamily protein